MIPAHPTTSRRMLLLVCPVAIGGSWNATCQGRLERELCSAIDAGALTLHYQPRFSLGRGWIVANEVLIRRPDDEQELVQSNVCILVDDSSDLINRLDVWVLAQACREAACWNAVRLSAAVSARQLHSGALPFHLATAFEQSGLPPDWLELEFKASSLVNSSTDTLLALSAIRDLGIGLALGGFGIGFATLSTLKRLPLTVMKLDRSLVRGLPMSLEAAMIARAMIETGRAMRLTTVAEGIETEAQRAFLSGIGCDEGQGCLFSHPVPARQLRPKLSLARS